MFQPTAKATATPPMRSNSGVRPRGVGGLALRARPRCSQTLQHDDGNLAVRLALVRVVVRPDLVHHPPQPLALLARGGAGARTEAVAEDLHADLRILREVAIPAGVRRRAALGRDDHGVLPVHAVDQGRRRLPAGVPSGRRQQQDRRALPPLVPLPSVSLAIAPNVLLAEKRAHSRSRRRQSRRLRSLLSSVEPRLMQIPPTSSWSTGRAPAPTAPGGPSSCPRASCATSRAGIERRASPSGFPPAQPPRRRGAARSAAGATCPRPRARPRRRARSTARRRGSARSTRSAPMRRRATRRGRSAVRPPLRS